MLKLFAIMLAVCAFGCRGVEAQVPAAGSVPAAPPTEFARFLDDSYRTLLARYPEAATQFGLSAWAGLDDTVLDGLSAEYLAETARLERAALAALEAIDMGGLSEADRLSADVYRTYLESAVRLQAFPERDFLVNPTVFGVAYAIEGLFIEIHPLDTADGVRSYAARLNALGAKLAEAADSLERREAAGWIAPRIVLGAALADLEALSYGTARDNPFYQRLEDALSAVAGLTADEKAALLAGAARAVESEIIPGYARLVSIVSGQRGRAPTEPGLWRQPGGVEYYAELLRYKTMTDLTPAEVHAMGLKALERIHADIRTAAARIPGAPTGDAASIVTWVFNRTGGVRPAQAVAEYKRILAAAIERAKPLLPLYPAAPVDVRTAPQGGYYQPGPIDGSRPGVFYVSESQGAWKAAMPTLVHHETVPGHHVQIAIAHELPLPVARKVLSFEAYAEGWALYSERLMAELGAYRDDPAGDIGRLQYEAFRAARLCVDTGVHAMKWTFEQAVDFMISQGCIDPGFARNEVMRYASIPAQATTYYVGFLTMLDLRDRAMKALGPRFDLGAFHATVLGCGSVPLSVLRQVVENWIAAEKAKP